MILDVTACWTAISLPLQHAFPISVIVLTQVSCFPKKVSVRGVPESDRRATEVAEKQGQKERRQGSDGRSEGGEPPPK